MCGFAGIFDPQGAPVNTAVLARMAEIMHHRGPDDSGLEVRSTHDESTITNLGFAFRRLSIIDLSKAGHQPMQNESGSLLMVYNGEIYNAPELQHELKDKGYRFHSTSDTEVILKLYEDRGIDAFAQLNGMFAIALWDRNRNQLHLVRDRLGIKPLYYSQAGTQLTFASEIKALLCHPDQRRRFDAQGVTDYMSFQFCLGETTLFDGIKLLPPATIHTYNTRAPQAIPQSTTFWRWQYRPNHERSLASFSTELRERLEGVLARQIRSDVPVGTFLSSGMDTGAISALAVRHRPHMHSFTCGFDTSGIDNDEKLFDERKEAQELANLLGTEHHTLTLQQDALQRYLKPTIWHMESPQVGISYQILAMAETVRQHVKVVLSGTGGDELFGGYHWRYKPLMDMKERSTLDTALYRQWCRLLDDDTRWQVLGNRIRHESDSANPRERFDAVMATCDTDDPLARMLHFELHGFLHGLLQLDDKLNMAYSVEARVPLLDNDILDLAQTIPSAMKYDGHTTKIVLKEALRGILPDAVINRRKQGFTPPDAHNMRTGNLSWIEGMLRTEAFREAGLIKPEAIDHILSEHSSGVRNHRFLIWALLCLNNVQALYMDDVQQQFTNAAPNRLRDVS